MSISREPHYFEQIPGNCELLTYLCTFFSPVPKLKWYRKSATDSLKTPVVNSADFKMERFNQYLSISDITTNKAGTYVCEASNSVGTVERET